MSSHKSRLAFEFSAESLFELGRRVYMWTFTFRRVEDDEVAFKCWKHLNTLLQREFRKGNDLPGLRVVEVHPGGHGLHFHMLVAKRLPVEVVRRLSIRAGFGRIHVCKAKRASWRYLAKYLTKSGDGLKKGCRKWGNFGTFKGSRVRDIVCESVLAENCRKVRAIVGCWGQSLFVAVNQLTVKHGHCTEWPSWPAFRDRPKLQRSDNDYELPDGLTKTGEKARFTTIKILDRELGEWVRVLIPDNSYQPF